MAHNVGFDFAFLAAEAELLGVELPIDTVMCTVELARRLELGTENLRLETLAAHWGISQLRPHDALDDAMVLAQILKPILVRARNARSGHRCDPWSGASGPTATSPTRNCAR